MGLSCFAITRPWHQHAFQAVASAPATPGNDCRTSSSDGNRDCLTKVLIYMKQLPSGHRNPLVRTCSTNFPKTVTTVQHRIQTPLTQTQVPETRRSKRQQLQSGTRAYSQVLASLSYTVGEHQQWLQVRGPGPSYNQLEMDQNCTRRRELVPQGLLFYVETSRASGLMWYGLLT